MRFDRAVLILLLLPALGCGTCNDKTGRSSEASADGGVSSRSLTPEQAGKVLARVGERTITLGDYVATLEHMDQFDRLRYQSPERRKELLTEMINIELLAKEATAKGYDQDPILQQQLRQILRDAMLAEARKGALSPNDIPEMEVRKYFEAHKADYHDPERRRLSLIILKDEKTAKDAFEAAKKTTTAAQWGELVRARSVDPQAKANVPVDLAGDVGMVSPPGDPRGDNAKVPEEVRAAAFEIKKIGEIADRVVKSGAQYYVVRLVTKTDPHDRTFAEAERTIRVKLAQDAIRAKEAQLLEELRKQYAVKIDDAVLATVKVDIPDVPPKEGAGTR